VKLHIGLNYLLTTHKYINGSTPEYVRELLSSTRSPRKLRPSSLLLLLAKLAGLYLYGDSGAQVRVRDCQPLIKVRRLLKSSICFSKIHLLKAVFNGK